MTMEMGDGNDLILGLEPVIDQKVHAFFAIVERCLQDVILFAGNSGERHFSEKYCLIANNDTMLIQLN
jgi:hypothetical protein